MWVYEGNWIKRKYKTQNWKSTLMVINTVGHLAEAAWHHPDITASYAWVEIRLTNHAAKGVTDKDFELAKKIENTIQWDPSKEKGSFIRTNIARDVELIKKLYSSVGYNFLKVETKIREIDGNDKIDLI